MKIGIFCNLGGKYFRNDELRFEMLKRSNEQFNSIRNQYLTNLKDKIDQYTKLFIKGYGNDINLLSCFRELMFNSRELLDSLLTKLNKLTKNSPNRTSRDFLSFAKKLMSSSYDGLNLEIINFLKINITYIFHIRKIRNEIKNNISNIKFRLATDHFESYFEVPIKDEELELIPYLDIANKDEAIKKRSYRATLILDKYFPEMIEFWKKAFTLLEKNSNSINKDIL